MTSTFVRRVDSRVPDYDLAGPVVAIGDHALERAVVYGVVLHLCCQPLLPGVQGGTLRDSPRPEHAIQLQAKVVVEPSSSVLLDYEAEVRGLTPGRCGRGLTRLRKVSLLLISIQVAHHMESLQQRATCPVDRMAGLPWSTRQRPATKGTRIGETAQVQGRPLSGC